MVIAILKPVVNFVDRLRPSQSQIDPIPTTVGDLTIDAVAQVQADLNEFFHRKVDLTSGTLLTETTYMHLAGSLVDAYNREHNLSSQGGYARVWQDDSTMFCVWYGRQGLSNLQGTRSNLGSVDDLVDLLNAIDKKAVFGGDPFPYDKSRLHINRKEDVLGQVEIEIPNPCSDSIPIQILQDSDVIRRYETAFNELFRSVGDNKTISGLTVHYDHKNIYLNAYFTPPN